MNRNHAMLTRISITSLTLAALLSGCGGGGDSGAPGVTNLIASPVMWGRTMTLTVNGTGLSSGITATVDPGCASMTRATTGGSDTQQTFTCKPTALGDLRVHVRSAEGAELGSLRLTVDTPRVSMTAKQGTQTGTFVLELDPVKAPKTVENFLIYINTSTCYYVNTLFHYVLANKGALGGGYNAGPTLKTAGTPIALESNNGLKNVRGAIAMYHGTDPNSATSQFFINSADNPSFDYVSETSPGYAVFGKILPDLQNGLAVIDFIQAVPTQAKTVEANGVSTTYENLPVDNVTISACSQIR